MKKLLALLLSLLLIFSMSAVAEEATMAERIAEINQDASITTTTALLDPTSPTGAYITFRYPASEDVVRVAVSADEMVYSDGSNTEIAPEDWQRGNWINANGRVAAARDMELVGDYWAATWPAINSNLMYYFYIAGPEDEYASLESTAEFAQAAIDANKQVWDPQNEPLIADWHTMETFAANQRRSLIYVPRAEGFTNQEMKDFTVQDPNGTDEKGVITFVEISGQFEEGAKDITCSVYLPYGYSEEHDEYPYLVLYHGANGDYSQWNAHGGMSGIFDNLIAQGQLEPTVVIMPDGTASNFNIEFIVNSILPFMEENYNVSKQTEDRALCGLSRGSMTAINLMQAYPEKFAYYGLLSGFGSGIKLAELPTDNLKMVYAGFGDNDTAVNGGVRFFSELALNPQIPQKAQVFHGAHHMYYWRQGLTDFAANYLWK